MCHFDLHLDKVSNCSKQEKIKNSSVKNIPHATLTAVATIKHFATQQCTQIIEFKPFCRFPSTKLLFSSQNPRAPATPLLLRLCSINLLAAALPPLQSALQCPCSARIRVRCQSPSLTYDFCATAPLLPTETPLI